MFRDFKTGGYNLEDTKVTKDLQDKNQNFITN
jgi:hypothetical protein